MAEEIIIIIEDTTEQVTLEAFNTKGDKGDKGDTGATGAKGDTGDQGIQGVQGDKGDKGYTPVKGTDYDDGEKGDTPQAEWDGTSLGFDGGPKTDLKGDAGDVLADVYRFESRVTIDGGITENIDGLIAEFPNLTTETLVMLPSAGKAGKLYNVRPTQPNPADFTVDRNSLARRVNAQGLIEEVGVNVPRLDYSDGSCPVLLTEPQSTNLITYSEDFSQWVKSGASVAGGFLAPDGNTSAFKFTEDTSTASHRIESNVIELPTTLKTITVSVLLKQGVGVGWVRLRESYTNTYLYVNLLDNSIGDNSNIISQKIVDFGNGYKRVSFTFTSETDFHQFRIYSANSSSNDFFTGDGVSHFYLFGAQVEALPYPTSYIPTQGTTVTRLLDNISVTVPAGVTEIIETINNIEQSPITVIPTTYKVPTSNLGILKINKIVMK